jgi:hypothetical protein
LHPRINSIFGKKHLSSGNIEMFPLLLHVQSQTDYKEIIPLIISHLKSLTENFDQYFLSLSSEMYDWVRDPFVEFSPNSQNLLKSARTTD